jgi:hypothetical protein
VRFRAVNFAFVGDDVAIESGAGSLLALAEGLTQFGPLGGEPEWLVSGIWLCAGLSQFILTATVDVLSDGFVARVLNICTPDELVAQIQGHLPDVSGRLVTRGSAISLADAIPRLSAPARLTRWPPGPYRMSVVVRTSQRASSPHRVACALHFVGERNNQLLVGTDITSIAMVMTQEPSLIASYMKGCEAYAPADYLERFGVTPRLPLQASPSAR